MAVPEPSQSKQPTASSSSSSDSAGKWTDSLAPVTEKVSELSSSVSSLASENAKLASEYTAEAQAKITSSGHQAMQVIKQYIGPVMDFYHQKDTEEGTILRKNIAVARQRVNEQWFNAETSINETRANLREQMAPVKAHWEAASTHLVKVDEFRRAYPNEIISVLSLAVGLPSLYFRGTWRAVQNVAVAATVAAAATHGVDTLEKALKDRKERKD